jgi:uncharacterized membrane protein
MYTLALYCPIPSPLSLVLILIFFIFIFFILITFFNFILIFLFIVFFYSDDAPKKDKVDDGAEKAKALEESKRKKVNLIDAKRGQNAGIALARIKVGFTEVRER